MNYSVKGFTLTKLRICLSGLHFGSQVFANVLKSRPAGCYLRNSDATTMIPFFTNLTLDPTWMGALSEGAQ